ncbi:hypothetical protein STEG23_028424, partial [Scotinomys teguina]
MPPLLLLLPPPLLLLLPPPLLLPLLLLLLLLLLLGWVFSLVLPQVPITAPILPPQEVWTMHAELMLLPGAVASLVNSACHARFSSTDKAGTLLSFVEAISGFPLLMGDCERTASRGSTVGDVLFD